MRITMAAALLAVLVAAGTARADYYSYRTESGTQAYTDDLKTVPARYRDTAVRHADKPLKDYPRLTIVPRGASYTSSVWAETALEPAPASRLERAGAPAGIALEAAPGVRLDVPDAEDAEDSEPLRIRRRVVWAEGGTRLQTVVRRGDETLAVIDGETLYLPE